uniref:Uncharacterized protein n=1 Tax=uncultured marine microorganism HF4000_APKG5H11 TaxID=455550 RepID=B3T8I7_9ZZZZ|nr:hypothetical protein ALOHA_HF4000APKG5H11ctg2g14 [uncultured marine microorganism HF4000_APKG5H11]
MAADPAQLHHGRSGEIRKIGLVRLAGGGYALTRPKSIAIHAQSSYHGITKVFQRV